MTREELQQLINELQQSQYELADIEVKSAHGGTPLALVYLLYLRHNQQITNFDYQRLAHVDSVTASRELRGLVQAELTSQRSSRRWTHYTLNVPIADRVEVNLPLLPEDKVLDYVRDHGFITRKKCAELLDLKDISARMFLFRMRDKGILKQTGFKKGSRYVLSE